MFGLVVIVALVAAVVVGTVLGHRYRVGPPVLLILSGSLLGLIPRFGDVQIDGEVVLLLFLPAILYWESMNTSFREIRWNLRVIVMFSIGLVIATAVAVSWTARALGMESHAAAVLGAVLSPTDAAAVAGLAKRLPRRALTVLRGESLINDGTALVLFAVTVAVAEGAAGIGPAALVGRFVVSYLGGIMAGLLVGGLVTLLRRRIDAPLEEGALSLLTPFAAFLLAQSLKCSGVVAVLVSALVLTYVGPTVIPRRRRVSRRRPLIEPATVQVLAIAFTDSFSVSLHWPQREQGCRTAILAPMRRWCDGDVDGRKLLPPARRTGTQQRRIRPAAPRVYTTGDILRDRKGIAPWQEQREPGWAPFGWLHEPSGARCPKADGQSV